MRFIEVKNIPNRNLKKDIISFINGFMQSSAQVAKVEYTKEEYKNYKACYNSLYGCSKRDHLPVSISVRNGEVYISKIVPEIIKGANAIETEATVNADPPERINIVMAKEPSAKKKSVKGAEQD